VRRREPAPRETPRERHERRVPGGDVDDGELVVFGADGDERVGEPPRGEALVELLERARRERAFGQRVRRARRERVRGFSACGVDTAAVAVVSLFFAAVRGRKRKRTSRDSSEGERLAPVSTRRREFPALALTQELQRGRGVARDRDVFTRFRGAAMDRERGAGGVRQDAKAERSPRANE
jgi:hypothetical protein